MLPVSHNYSQSNFVAGPKQAARIAERRTAAMFEIERCGLKLEIDPGVYDTSADSELMARSVELNRFQTFLEIGCGTGLVSLALSRQAKSGVGTDINPRAVANSRRNALKNKINNVEFLVADVFGPVDGRFDVVVCNPPYSRREASDEIEKMFWDPQDEMKQKFFKQVGDHLLPGGTVYFGWANFSDLEPDLPLVMAEKNGFKLLKVFRQTSTDGAKEFLVFKFKKTTND